MVMVDEGDPVGAGVERGRQANFDPGASKILVLWTDAPFHQPGDPGDIPYPGYSLEQVADAINSREPMKVIGIAADPSAVGDLEQLAIATGSLAPAGGVDCDGDGMADVPEGDPLVCSSGLEGDNTLNAIVGSVSAAFEFPVATAGPFQAVEAGGSGDASVRLDGTGSTTSAGDTLSYQWEGPFGVVSGSTPVVTLPIGIHDLRLTVTDGDGNSSTDTTSVVVRPRPAGSCKMATYEAETMFHSTGGSTPGGWNIWANGFISTTHDFSSAPTRIYVVARGEPAFGVWPHMIVSVNGAPIGDVSVNSLDWESYAFDFDAGPGPQEIRITFDNDFFSPPFDRNLLVDNLRVICTGEPDPDPPNPCASFCASPEVITWSGSYQSGNLGTGAICRETTQPVAGGNCGNFAPGRQLFLNGTAMPCDTGNWPSLPAPVAGGYCIHTTPGDFPWAFLTLW
jgi:hypothetical protein